MYKLQSPVKIRFLPSRIGHRDSWRCTSCGFRSPMVFKTHPPKLERVTILRKPTSKRCRQSPLATY
jgi:hypothetical protein